MLRDQPVAARPVGVFGFDFDAAPLAEAEAVHGGVEAGDGLPRADDELERLAALRGVEDLAAFQPSRIMDAHGVALFGLFCHNRILLG